MSPIFEVALTLIEHSMVDDGRTPISVSYTVLVFANGEEEAKALAGEFVTQTGFHILDVDGVGQVLAPLPSQAPNTARSIQFKSIRLVERKIEAPKAPNADIKNKGKKKEDKPVIVDGMKVPEVEFGTADVTAADVALPPDTTSPTTENITPPVVVTGAKKKDDGDQQ